MRLEGGGLSKIPSKGMEQKRGEGTQKFKKQGGSKLVLGVDALKKRGLEPPYELCIY